MAARRLLLIAAAAAAFTLPAAAQQITLLAAGDTGDWEYQVFDDIVETSYRQTADDDGRGVLSAVSNAGASGFIRRMELSLYDTPWLYFRWRVDQADANAAEQTRAGDDFAWRLYFVGRSGLQYKSLNLVYAHTAAAGSSWQSPYAELMRDLQIYVAAAHEEDALGQWQTTAINVGELWRQTFGDDGEIGLIGIMTDGDNSGITVRAHYGEIMLSAQEADSR